MKKRFFIMLSLLIILAMFLTVPVSAEGMERKTISTGEWANIGQLHNVLDERSHPIHPCIMGRRFSFTRLGKPNGLYGCLYRFPQYIKTKFRW